MKIGIGIITMQKRLINPNIFNLISKSVNIYIHVDKEGKGPAKSRNECIKNLYDNGCTDIFMFDDDCYPIMNGWEDYIIENARNNDLHFISMPEVFKTKLLNVNGEVTMWDGAIGCFSYQTRKFIETVGYYNTKYNRYGFEDNARNYRAIHSGLCGEKGSFPSLLRLPNYIYSEDVYNKCPIVNISFEDKERYILENRAIFEEEIKLTEQGIIYYPYEQTKSIRYI